MELAKRAAMSDTELRHRKRLQAVASRGTSTAGLTSLGLLGASVVAGRKGSHKVATKLRNASLNTSIAGAGLSGISGFNFARIQSEEARKGAPVKLKKSFDPEARRDRRNKVYTGALAAGSGAAGGAAGYQGARAGMALRRAVRTEKVAGRHDSAAVKFKAMADEQDDAAKAAARQKKKGSGALARQHRQFAVGAMGERSKELGQARAVRLAKPRHLREAKHLGTRAGALAAGSAVLAGGAVAVDRHRKGAGRTYNGWWEHRY